MGGETLRSGVSGLHYNSDVLLFDRASASLWSQLTKTAISGARRGQRLRTTALSHTSWADWRKRHPATIVLSEDTGFARDYSRNPYAGYDKVQQLMFDVEHRDDRLPLKERMIGVQVGQVFKAYLFGALERRVNAQEVVRDTLAGQKLRIHYDARHRTAQVFDARDQPWPPTMALWFAWFAFHPDTEVLSPR